MEPRCQILLVSGSLRAGSTNTAVLRTACAVAPDNVRTVMYDGMAFLPHFNPDDEREGEPVHPAGADAHDSLRKVLGYVHASIVEEACTRIPLARGDVGALGVIEDVAVRDQITQTLAALARHVR